jgi:hypothetical protein
VGTDRVQCGRVALHQRPMPCRHWFVDHKVVVYWVAAIASGPLPSYVTGLAPASPGQGPRAEVEEGGARAGGQSAEERKEAEEQGAAAAAAAATPGEGKCAGMTGGWLLLVGGRRRSSRKSSDRSPVCSGRFDSGGHSKPHAAREGGFGVKEHAAPRTTSSTAMHLEDATLAVLKTPGDRDVCRWFSG